MSKVDELNGNLERLIGWLKKSADQSEKFIEQQMRFNENQIEINQKLGERTANLAGKVKILLLLMIPLLGGMFTIVWRSFAK